jgi:broad specificity phosphatase PhoE
MASTSAHPCADGFLYALHPLDSRSLPGDQPHLRLHLVRHAQGVHNLAHTVSQDRAIYKSEEWADAKLTDEGKGQCESLKQTFGSKTHLDVVLTSSLSRTVQTAFFGLGLTNPDGSPRPFVALDLTRERSGVHPCDRRRPTSELAADFPFLDVKILRGMAGEEDSYYNPDKRESWPELCGRAESFLQYLREHHGADKGKVIAAVTHNDFLQGLLLRSRLHLTDRTKLAIKFSNAQVLSTVLTWEKAEEGALLGTGAGAMASGPDGEDE